MARELQKLYYNNNDDDEQTSSFTTQTSSIPHASTVLRNLPTLTTRDGIQNADETALLPGYQFVWNIYNPQHCHMFHSILSSRAPWYFAHVYLPNNTPSNSESIEGEKNNVPIDSVQTYNDIQAQLNSDSPMYATLLRITDRRFHDGDGSIVLAVQAIDRVRIHNIASLPGTNLRTDVQISPEREIMRSYFNEALMTSASYLADIGESNESLSCTSAINGAARAAAVADTLRIRKFEFLPIFLEEKPYRPASLKSNQNDSNVKKMIKKAILKKEEESQSGPEYVSVVQLCNYCAFEFATLSNPEIVTSQALKTYWGHLAKESQIISTEEEVLFSGNGSDDYSSSTSFFLPEPAMHESSPPVSSETIETMECNVWRKLDEMICLLSMAASATVPLPSQLLGLLPTRDDWPKEFALEAYAKSLSTSRSSIGTTFKSPFVRVDQISSSTSSAKYSPLRRAQRLSYAIWLLLDGLVMTGADPPPPPRHLILEMDIEQRLDAATQTLEGINDILRRMIPKNRKDSDDKK